MRSKTLVATIFFMLQAVLVSVCQDALDGPRHIFQDSLLENMVGSWNLNGQIMHHDVIHSVDAQWVLNHQFLRIHEKATPAAKAVDLTYEALVMVGYDNASERYVAHWMDIYGGRFSETLGFGKRSGNDIEFVFEYADGPFHTTFRWNADSHQWQWLMRGKNKDGQWFEFGDMTLARNKEH